jgi:hypothetical protein
MNNPFQDFVMSVLRPCRRKKKARASITRFPGVWPVKLGISTPSTPAMPGQQHRSGDDVSLVTREEVHDRKPFHMLERLADGETKEPVGQRTGALSGLSRL